MNCIRLHHQIAQSPSWQQKKANLMGNREISLKRILRREKQRIITHDMRRYRGNAFYISLFWLYHTCIRMQLPEQLFTVVADFCHICFDDFVFCFSFFFSLVVIDYVTWWVCIGCRLFLPHAHNDRIVVIVCCNCCCCCFCILPLCVHAIYRRALYLICVQFLFHHYVSYT